jgi:hypothetical protein
MGTTMPTCRHCSRPTTRYGRLCNAHATQQRRHGHALQERIPTRRLEPHLTTVKERLRRDPQGRLMPALEGRWVALVGFCGGIITEWERGAPSQKHDREAAEAVRKLATEVPVEEIATTLLAMYLLQYSEPQALRSDDAFRSQLVRRVRGLGELGVGVRWDHAQDRERRLYRDLAPRTVTRLARWLTEAFGQAGVTLAHMERRDREKSRLEADTLHEALAAIS